jgi:hypothetical protein
VYNAVWLIAILLPFIGAISYRTGFIVFTAVTVFRLSANLYLNNILTAEQAGKFPFRS